MGLNSAQNLNEVGTYLPRRINRYVPALQYSVEVDTVSRIYRSSLGAPAAASSTAVVNTQAIGTAGSLSSGDAGLLLDTLDGEYGRNLTMVASGAATDVIEVEGRDYLGQPMYEAFTLNGTTSVVGVKAFKYIDQIKWPGTTSVNLNVGTGTKFGLPFRTNKVIAEDADGVTTASLGTLTAGVRTDPQTATTGDPRGLYVPNTTPNGSKVIVVLAMVDPFINANGNGGLYGIKHYHETP